jgi:hypothetical protein
MILSPNPSSAIWNKTISNDVVNPALREKGRIPRKRGPAF